MNDLNQTEKSKGVPLTEAAGDDEAVSSLEALSHALKSGFHVVKGIMLVLAVVFFFSNIFWVPEGYVVVQSRFGKIVGAEAAAVRRPGGPYLAFPYPMDEVFRIPTTIQKLSLYNAFWSEEATAAPKIDARPETDHLRPGVHGSLVTADKNLVQGIWVIHYKVLTEKDFRATAAGAADFVRNVGSMERAGKMIRRIGQAAIIRVVSRTPVAEFAAGQIDNQAICQEMDRRLRQLRTGLTVTSVSASRYTVPKVLEPDFEAVTHAESQKALDIERASRHRASTLNELAGSGWKSLLNAVRAHEKALENTDKSAEKKAFEAAKAVFLAEAIGGDVKQILDEARSEKTATIQRTRASAARFAELLPAYEKNPRMLEEQLVKDSIKKIWSAVSVDALYLPKGQKLFLDLGVRRPLNE